jgi:hypothetical protein
MYVCMYMYVAPSLTKSSCGQPPVWLHHKIGGKKKTLIKSAWLQSKVTPTERVSGLHCPMCHLLIGPEKGDYNTEFSPFSPLVFCFYLPSPETTPPPPPEVSWCSLVSRRISIICLFGITFIENYPNWKKN